MSCGECLWWDVHGHVCGGNSCGHVSGGNSYELVCGECPVDMSVGGLSVGECSVGMCVTGFYNYTNACGKTHHVWTAEFHRQKSLSDMSGETQLRMSKQSTEHTYVHFSLLLM